MKNASRRLIQSIEEIGRLYDFLNDNFFESALSKPVITIMPEDRRKKNFRIMGWFSSQKIWSEKSGERDYELNVSADYTYRSLPDIAATVLHEMVHQYAIENGIEDTSRDGTYHNKRFAKIAEDHGFKVSQQRQTGFSKTELTDKARQIIDGFSFERSPIFRHYEVSDDETLERINKEVPEDTPDREKVIEDMFKAVREGKLKYTKNGYKPIKCSTRKYVCPNCGMSIRATRTVNIICGDCKEKMKCVEDAG